MKITELRCAVIGKNPIVRITTDEGISGYGEVERYEPYLEPHILHEREALLGMDPCDCGGIAELEWIAEFAQLHGVLLAPHGTGDGLLGRAALVQVCATLPHNFIAFEYPASDPAWWYDIVDGLPSPIVEDGRITVFDRPGMGVEIVAAKARPYPAPADAGLFD